MRGAVCVVVSGLIWSSGCAYRRAGVEASPVRKAMVSQVRNAVRAGDGDAEVRLLRHRIAAEPENVALRLKLAERYGQAGFSELAIEHLRLAAERFRDHAEVHVRLARALREEELPGEAARLLEEYVGRHPEAPAEVWALLGISRDELGEYEAAQYAHRRALEQAPHPRAWLYNNLGYNLLLQGKTASAEHQFRAALRLEPRHELARNNLAAALAARPAEAVVHLQSVTDPATAHSNMAAVLIEQGRLAEARQHLYRALGYRRDHVAALRNLALVAELDGKGMEWQLPSQPRRGRAKPEVNARRR